MKKSLVTGLRIVAVCLLFIFCMAIGVALSGLSRLAPATPAQGNAFLPLLLFSLCVGAITSYLILRSKWHGWTLAGAIFVGTYGISTVVTQIESVFFLMNKLGPQMIRAIFVQGAISAALFAPLAVLLLGKWRTLTPAEPAAPHMRAASAVWRIAFLVVAFVFLYMFFGYYVAWQNPELRRYYGGQDWPSFLASIRGNWTNAPWIFAIASLRALLYVAFVYPLIRMLRVARWETAMAIPLFLSAWTTVLLLPNPVMPASVARSHFWETLGFSLIVGVLLGWLLGGPPAVVRDRPSVP